MDFMEEAKGEYDIILFDSTPILSTADAAILGTKVDRVLLVYRLGNVSRGLLKRSTTQLKQVNCDLMGVILNGMRPEVSPDFHDYKYYKYHYSYGGGGRGRSRRGAGPKKGFLSLRGKGDRTEIDKQEVLPSKAGRVTHKQGMRHNILRLSILGIALIFLAFGILWQNGIIDPFELISLEKADKRDEIQGPVRKKIPKRAIQEKAKTIATRPRSPVNTPTPPSPPIKRAAVEDKKGISRPIIQKRVKRSSPKPKTEVSHGKTRLEAKTPVPPSPPVAKGGGDIEKSATHKSPLSYPYSLYLGSFRTLKRAKRAISIYRKKDLSPYWVKVELRKGVWYRVYAGYFEDYKGAEGLKKKYGLTEATIKKIRYANLVGTYTSSDELERQILSLKKLGNSPYFIKDHNGKTRLFVGAFLTRAGAERQYHELKSSGIENKVVKR